MIARSPPNASQLLKKLLSSCSILQTSPPILAARIDYTCATSSAHSTLHLLSDCYLQLLSKHKRLRMKFPRVVVLALAAFDSIGVSAQEPRKLRNRLLAQDDAADRDLLSFFNVMANDMSIASDAPSSVPSQAPCELFFMF